jgi:hypothetical protein
MARWYVVTEGPKVPVGRVVAKVLGREDLEGGRVRWLVEAPDFVRALPSCFKGFLVVEPASRDAQMSNNCFYRAS